MTPSITISKITKALQNPLPGWFAQKQMAPEARLNLVRNNLIKPNHREGSVLLLLYPDHTNQLHLVFIRRPVYEGVHSGQIAFPGGKREAGESRAAAALRETQEEIGVPRTNLTLLGSLTPLYIPPSNFMVYPHVAYQPITPTFNPDPAEVAEIIEAPLTLLFDDAIKQSEMRYIHRLGNTEVPHYNIFGHQVWGATAMITSEFTTILSLTYDKNTSH